MWTEQKVGQGLPKHVDRAKGSPKHVDRAKGWTGFAKTCGQSTRVSRVRQNMWTEHKG